MDYSGVFKIVMIGEERMGISTFLEKSAVDLFSDSVVVSEKMDMYYLIESPISDAD